MFLLLLLIPERYSTGSVRIDKSDMFGQLLAQ
jgi:hypothetical protein